MTYAPLAVRFSYTSTRLLPLPLALTLHMRTDINTPGTMDQDRYVYLELGPEDAARLYQALQDFMLRVRYDG